MTYNEREFTDQWSSDKIVFDDKSLWEIVENSNISIYHSYHLFL